MITRQKDYVTPKQGLIVKYQGEFDLKKLYGSLKDWFKRNGYALTEKEYKEKPGVTGTEFNLILNGERKIDDYSSFNIDLQMLILNARLVGQRYNGKSKTNVSGYILLDRKNKWQGNPLGAFLFFVYNNVIIKNKIENLYEDKLYSEILDLINNLKEYINVR